MGYALRRMIRDGAPRSWTSLMRDVAKEIADDARDPSPDNPPPGGRLPWSTLRVEGYRDPVGVWHDGLAEICGATPRAISDALTQLGRDGYEMRQPVTDRYGRPVVDKRGRIVYAAKGHSLRFCVPQMERRAESQSSHEGATFDDDSSHEGAGFEAQRSHPAVSKVAPECDPVPSLSPQPLIPHKEPSVANSQHRGVHNGPETMADDAHHSRPNDAESTTAGSTRGRVKHPDASAA